jgi:hypothetical protein
VPTSIRVRSATGMVSRWLARDEEDLRRKFGEGAAEYEKTRHKGVPLYTIGANDPYW